MQARHFLQGGKKNPEVAGDGRGGGDKVVGSDGKNKGVGFGKKDRLMECSQQSYFCPRRGLAAARPVSRKGQGSMLSAQCTEQPSALLVLKAGSGFAPFYFCPHIHLLQCQLTLLLPSCTPVAQTRARKAPRWVCSPSLPCSSSLRKFKLLIFHFFKGDFTYHPHPHPRTP